MRFIKYHGLGNDFVVSLDTTDEQAPSPAFAQAVCARGAGAGADGLMWMGGGDADADVAMRLLNSDGSTPEMCGNGIRCLVKYAVDVAEVRQNPLRVRTNGGVRVCEWEADTDGRVARVKVDMGPPSFDRARIPMTGDGAAENVTLEVDGETLVVTGVNTGNPHMVCFGDSSLATAKRLGPILTHHPQWPEGANVEFATQRSPTHFDATVWERGCGLTQACGTGATAVVAAAVRLGMAAFDTPITVSLPGGDLVITIERDFATAWMDGPAVEVYRGTLSPDGA